MRPETLLTKSERWWFELDPEEREKLARIYHSTEDVSSLSKFDIEELYDDAMLTEKIRQEDLLIEWDEWQDEVDGEDYFDDEDWP